MHRQSVFPVVLILLALCSSVLPSCKKSVKDDNWSSNVAKYVYAYTSGDIGRSDAVRVRFVSPAVGQDKVNSKVDASIFSVSPTIQGDAIWEDVQTIRLTPAQPLPYGQQYEATVNLGKLFGNVDKTVRVFDFKFRVRQLSLHLEVDGLQTEDGSGGKRQKIYGTVSTSDKVDNTALEKILSATQGNQRLSIGWTHDNAGTQHRFYVNDVTRTNVRSKVQLEWSGKSLDIKDKGNKEVTIPALDEFTPLSVVAEGPSALRINFSDAIAADQQLAGLITFEGYAGNITYAVDGNFVHAYLPGADGKSGNLTIEPGIKSTTGATLVARSQWPVTFEYTKPQVRLVGRGVIIPPSDNGAIIFPFEAIGLNAVDVEVFKIHNNNILQFLQINDLEGDNQLERVGKIIVQQKVSLSELNPDATAHNWHHYGLDLRPLIERDPSAIYQVRLAFRKGYTAMACGGAEPDESDAMSHFGRVDEDGQMVSIWGGYRGVYYSDEDEYYGDGEDYDWSNRDNPCQKEYYQYQNFASRNVFVSDLGLLAKRGRDGSAFVAVTNLLDAGPVSGASLEFFDFQLQPILKVQTDGDGTAMVENFLQKPFFVVAQKGNSRGYLRLADGASLSLSRFDVAGVESQKGLKGYLYGERGVWRPGDSIFLNFVLEDRVGNLPAGHPVSFELTDPKGATQYKTTSAQSVGGVYAFHCATAPSAPTGDWTAKVQVGSASFTRPVKIETVKPNRLKINLDFGAKFLTAENENAKGNLQVNWLHGAPGQSLRAKVECTVRAVKTQFDQMKDFVFDDPARSFFSEPQVLFDGVTDGSGAASVPLSISAGEAAPGKLIAAFKVRAFEAGGDFSTDNFALDYFPYERFAGIAIPQNQWGSKEISQEKGGEVQFALVDRNGKPLANQTLDVGLYRCDWRWWWDEDRMGNVAQYNSAQHLNAMQRGQVKTDGRGVATWKVQPNQWGRYLVRVSDPEGGHCAGDFFWTGYPDVMEDNMASRNAAAMLPFAADKEKYTVGETVKLKVPATEDGKILVTLETGSRVIESKWYTAKAGDNLLSIETDDRMAPSVYAHINLFQPHAQTKNNLPIRMYGVAPIAVENPVTHLKPQIDMPDVLKPGESFAVAVRETSGKACAYTLAIVDEGLLDLTRFETPDPWKTFYAREALGVKTWDVYDHVLGAYGAALERILSVGGDGINQKAKNAAQVNRFKPALRHIGPFYLDKGKTARHNITLDNYVGSVRVMAVCSAPAAAGKGAYGMAEKTCPVRKSLMLLPTLPRVLGPGETLRLPVEVFANEGKIKRANIKVRETSGLVSVGQQSNSLNFAQPGSQLAFFDLKVGNKAGVAKFIIEGEGGGEVSKEEIEIAVRNPNPTQTRVWEGRAEAGGAWNSSVDASSFAEVKNAVLEVSTLPAINLNRHLGYLLQYPHGCIEQTTSSAFPQLYVDVLMPLTDQQRQTASANIQAAIEKIRNFQAGDGGFSYWPGGGPADEWGSSYAGHFLIEAKNKGYALPAGLLENWQTYQTNMSRKWSTPGNNQDFYGNTLAQAYRLYTLALAGAPDAAGMNRLRETKGLYVQSASLLAAAFARSGKAEAARELINQSWREDWRYEWWGYTYGSDLRDRALLLETYTAIGDKNRTAAALQSVCDQLGAQENYGWSTQSLATSLRALSYYVTKNSPGGAQYTWQAGNGKAEKGDASKPISVANITQSLQKGAGNFSVTNKGSGPLYVRLVVEGQPVAGAETAQQSNLSIAVRYTDTKGNAVDVNRLKKGTDFVAEVTVRRDASMGFPFQELALSQVFPSGWEVLNSRMNNALSTGTNSPMDYQDIRDDRIYTYFDLPRQNEARVYRVQLNAAYAGRYYLPGVSCEAMYDNRIRARETGRWVEVL